MARGKKKPKVAPSNCHCVNHLGKRKHQYQSKDTALKKVVSTLRYGHPLKVVVCKDEPRVWHIITIRR